jgi:DNA gyrase subunit B
MDGELLTRGIEGAKLIVAAPEGSKEPARTYEGERLQSLLAALDEVEKYLTILEKRGQTIAILINEMKNNEMPMFKITLGNQVSWRFSRAEVDAFREEKIASGHVLMVADDEAKATAVAVVNGVNGASGATPNALPHGEIFSFQELHEVKKVNQGLEKLRGFGLAPSDLVVAPRIAGREPVQRFFLEAHNKTQALAHLRVLVAEVRKLGEHGMKITRFKGLGEMDGEELWDTTLDPARRTLLQVQLEDVLKAEDMFRTLMGEKVEPRRDFIHKHALEVKEIDYHGA